MFINDLWQDKTNSQESRPIRLVASNGLTNIYKGGLTRFNTKSKQISKKSRFYK